MENVADDLNEVSGTVARMGKSWPGTPGTEMLSILMLTMSSVMTPVCLPRLGMTWSSLLAPAPAREASSGPSTTERRTEGEQEVKTGVFIDVCDARRLKESSIDKPESKSISLHTYIKI